MTLTAKVNQLVAHLLEDAAEDALDALDALAFTQEFNNRIIDGMLVKADPKMVHAIIPNSVTSIGRSAFDSCTRLASVTIPNSVTSIGNNTFAAGTKIIRTKAEGLAVDYPKSAHV